jgi:hypothetical protein
MRALTQIEMSHVGGSGFGEGVMVVVAGGAIGAYVGAASFGYGLATVCTMFNQTFENCIYAINGTEGGQSVFDGAMVSFAALGGALGVAAFGIIGLVAQH